MKKNFNYWVSKALEIKNLAQAMEQTRWIYFKYIKQELPDDYCDVVDEMDFENLETLADRIQYELDLEIPEIQDLWTYTVTSQLLAEGREA